MAGETDPIPGIDPKYLQVIPKEDSPCKIAYIIGKPLKWFLKATEFEVLRSFVNKLRDDIDAVTAPNLTEVLTKGDLEFQQIDINPGTTYTFQVADRLKKNYFREASSAVMNVFLDNRTFPDNSIIRFKLNDFTNIFENLPASPGILLKPAANTVIFYNYSIITEIFIQSGDCCQARYLGKDEFGVVAYWVLEITDKAKKQGLLSIYDPLGEHFTDLATAHGYVQAYTLATITDESYSNSTYYFTVPANTAFDEIGNFCQNSSASFTDNYGLVTSFADSAFAANLGEGNTLGYCNFGNECFINAVPKIKNTIKGIVSCGSDFANQYTGRIDILDSLGTDETATLNSGIFTTTNLCSIHVPLKLNFNNAGSPDGDLANIITNASNANTQITFC